MKIKITIEGREGDGKTTAAQIIKRAMETAGYDVVVYDDEPGFPSKRSRKHVEVTIETKTVSS
jgi:thymidylate kinase